MNVGGVELSRQRRHCLALWEECGHPWGFLVLAPETQGGGQVPRCAFFQPFSSYVVITCCVPGTVLGAGGLVENQTDNIPARAERRSP